HRVLAAPRPLGGAAVDGEAVVRRGVLLRRTEGEAEVVLGAGAVQARRPRLAVDEDHVVALAVPVVHLPLEDVDVQVAADVLAVAVDVEDRVVPLAGQVRARPRAREAHARAARPRVAVAIVGARVAVLARRAGRAVDAVPPGMEAADLRVDRAELLVVDVEEEEPLPLALVLDLEARAVLERHREPAVEAPAV